MVQTHKKCLSDPTYRVFVDYHNKKIMGVDNGHAQQCVIANFDMYSDEYMFETCNDLLSYGGFTTQQAGRSIFNSKDACELLDPNSKITLRSNDADQFLSEVNHVLGVRGDESTLAANYSRIDRLFDFYSRYGIDFFKNLLLQVDSRHVGQARILLVLFHFPEHRDVARKLYHMEEFKYARRIIERTFLTDEDGQTYHKIVKDEHGNLNEPFTSGVFYSLTDLKASNATTNDYFRLMKTDFFSQMGDTFFKLEFHKGTDSVLFGLKNFNDTGDSTSRILVKYSIEPCVEEETRSEHAEDPLNVDGSMVEHFDKIRPDGSIKQQDIRPAEADENDKESEAALAEEWADAQERGHTEKELYFESRAKKGRTIDKILEIEANMERNVGDLMDQNYFNSWGYNPDGSVYVKFYCFYPLKLTFEQYIAVLQEIDMYNVMLKEAGIMDVQVIFDSRLPDGHFDVSE